MSLDCLFLIAPSVFSNVYLTFHAHIYLFWNVRSYFFRAESLALLWFSTNELTTHESKQRLKKIEYLTTMQLKYLKNKLNN